jgi:plasmid stabilization system protein ParE
MKARFLNVAQQELDDAVAWYGGDDEDLGLAFLDEIDRTLRRILRFPLASTEIEDGIRRALVSRFPYAIIYGIDEDLIVVLAVAHLRRHPRYWADRVY